MILSENNRILVLDGAMGTMIQKHVLSEDDYIGDTFTHCHKELRGNNECLNLSRPDIIEHIHAEYIKAGADIIETNTFSANRISQSEYECEDFAARMAYAGAKIARCAADKAMAQHGRKVWVAGSMGPTSKSLSLSPDASDPTFRPYSFEDMKEAYREQAEALLDGGADLLLIETCFDALNVKAALVAISEISGMSDTPVPVIISVSIGDRSGRTLTGQTLEAFYTSIKHYPILAFGLNCSLGAAELIPYMEDVASWCRCSVSCYPNAGLPNEMGEYSQTPQEMASQIREMASRGLIDIVGGCCGTTPEHIRAIAESVADLAPRNASFDSDDVLRVSGLETAVIDMKVSNFTNIGERTNVAGSRKFAKLIAAGEYDEATMIAAKQIEDGAPVIDINMDDAMLDSAREMEKFVRCISNDPAVAKAALMIDSSNWETILKGLQNAQGKCIVNSISLKEGEAAFIEKARTIRTYGAATVVMAFDEQGQATTYGRKIEICARAYRLLTEVVGMNPHDIIFDANILSIGTGIEEHARYAIDFIEAVRWIKTNLPGALTSGGVSNLSFAFRGNNPVREAMHSAFLYHAIKAGLDMAIVNPSMLQLYDDIEPGLLKCVEDVIFNADPQATERLIEKASMMLKEKTISSASQAQPSDILSCQSIEERLKTVLIKGCPNGLEDILSEAMVKYGNAISIIEGPLMEGMNTVGELFGSGKMFLPQVVKSAKVMRDAAQILESYINIIESSSEAPRHTDTKPFQNRTDEASDISVGHRNSGQSTVVLATVKGDVHDIGKNITGIVLTCNGFDVHDLGVMIDKETILEEAERLGADIIAVSGLITPSLYQMEEICREMASRRMSTPLFIGGATTSALHTAVKLAPLYDHVFYGPDASAAAVMAQKYMMDKEAFEKEQHAEQDKIRKLYYGEEIAPLPSVGRNRRSRWSECVRNDNNVTSSEVEKSTAGGFAYDTYLTECPADIPLMELHAEEIMPYFDWKMFYAIWGVKYGSAVPEAMELIQLRRDAEDEIALGDFRIMLNTRFFMGNATGHDQIKFEADEEEIMIPMMRQEGGKGMSLADFVIPAGSSRKSPFGLFAISVQKKSKAHVHGCSCPACSNHYEDMIGRTVRMTLAEAASSWLDTVLRPGRQCRIIKPAAGYASCPDHTLKRDILNILDKRGLGIELTESYAMTPESSICGLIFMHPEATYPEIRRIGKDRYEDYAKRRGMDADTARRFIGHLLK